MLKLHIRILPILLLILTVIPVSCLDETLVSTTYAVAEADDDADMYLSISVPRTYTATGEVVTDKEVAVKTLDVLVFREGKDADAGKFFVYAACKGKLTDTERTFQVVMPVGDNLIVHVFVNCRKEMIARNFYKSRGKEMGAMLSELTLDADPNAAATDSLPMHGYLTKMTINKDMVGKTFTVPVIRSVAAVQVMTKVTETTDADGKTTLTPGVVTDADGKKTFDLRELYVYHYSTAGRVAADAASYEPLAAGAADKTRNVAKPTLPVGHKVADTRIAGTADQPKPYSLVSATAVDKLGCLYLYENRPHTTSGLDLDFTEKTTTRLIIGGVYANDKNPDGTPRVTYHRVDFADADNNLLSVLRNHKYIVSVEKVTAPGYATPDEAAISASTNVYIRLFDWADELTNSDFNSENYFNSETKTITLYRYQNATRSITVDSDVAVDEWKMSFATTANGTATVSGNFLSNARYKVEKAADGKSLTFTALKTYSPLSGTESHDETLIIRANRLQVEYKITQTDASPDDWADGGDENIGVGDDILANDVLSFIVAPTDLMAVSNGLGGYNYMFAPTQAYDKSTRSQRIFSWNDFIPNRAIRYATWSEDRDPCRKVPGGKWYTPTADQCREMINKLQKKWDTFPGSTQSGVYWYTSVFPTTEDEKRRTIFLAATGYDGGWDNQAYYWTRTSGSNTATQGTFFRFDKPNYYGLVSSGGRASKMTIRCVTDKPKVKNKK